MSSAAYYREAAAAAAAAEAEAKRLRALKRKKPAVKAPAVAAIAAVVKTALASPKKPSPAKVGKAMVDAAHAAGLIDGKHVAAAIKAAVARVSPKAASPKKASPKRKSPSPKRKTPSPKRKTPSPKRKSPSPKRKTPSPAKKASPKRKSPSPKKASPKRKSPSPAKKASPKRKSPSPAKKASPAKKGKLGPKDTWPKSLVDLVAKKESLSESDIARLGRRLTISGLNRAFKLRAGRLATGVLKRKKPTLAKVLNLFRFDLSDVWGRLNPAARIKRRAAKKKPSSARARGVKFSTLGELLTQRKKYQLAKGLYSLAGLSENALRKLRNTGRVSIWRVTAGDSTGTMRTLEGFLETALSAKNVPRSILLAVQRQGKRLRKGDPKLTLLARWFRAAHPPRYLVFFEHRPKTRGFYLHVYDTHTSLSKAVRRAKLVKSQAGASKYLKSVLL